MNQPTLFDQDLTIPYNQFKGNQAILDSNREHFAGQTLLVFNELMKGGKVSSLWAVKQGIIDVRARIFTLRKKGVEVTEAKIVGGHGSKCWSMSPEQVEANKLLLK